MAAGFPPKPGRVSTHTAYTTLHAHVLSQAQPRYKSHTAAGARGKGITHLLLHIPLELQAQEHKELQNGYHNSKSPHTSCLEEIHMEQSKPAASASRIWRRSPEKLRVARTC